MKRDMSLIRVILLKVEEHEHGGAPQNIEIDGYSDETVGYHIHLMGQAGLLRVNDIGFTRCGRSPYAYPVSMTWAGHDFLDAARSDTIWARTCKHLGTDLASVPFEALKALLVKFLSESLGISGG